MAEQTAKILAVTPSGAKYGPNKDKEIFLVVTDPASPGGVYKTFHQNLAEKVGQTVTFDVREEEYKGKKEYVLQIGGREGGGRPGGKSYGKSADELALMREDMKLRAEMMLRSYAKDLMVAMLNTTVFVPKTDSEFKTKFDWLVSVVRGNAPTFKSDQLESPQVSADEIPF